jgi:hypothetical protein
MISLPSPAEIKRIEVFTLQIALGGSASSKLTITNHGGRFVRQQALEPATDELHVDRVAEFLAAFAHPPVPELDCTMFSVPAAAIQRHYDSVWTDDSPSHLFRVHCEDHRLITIRADSQHTFMLPLRVTDSATGAEYQTFDPELSRALAELMPAEYLLRDRLAGTGGLLSWDIEQTLIEAGELPAEAPPDPATTSPDDETLRRRAWLKGLAEAARADASRDASIAARSARNAMRLLWRTSLNDLRELIARGGNPRVADHNGVTALMRSTDRPFEPERFRLLLAAGADVHARTHEGDSGLHLECCGGEPDAVAMWLQAGADVNARTPQGVTPLMLGARRLATVRLLLDHGADASTADDQGRTALDYAVREQCYVGAAEQLATIRTLLDAGADASQRDHAGESPIAVAQRHRDEALVEEEVWQAINSSFEPSYRGWSRRSLAEAVLALLTASV